MLELDPQQLATLSQISQTINRADNVLGVLDDVLAKVVDLIGQQAGWILLRDEFKDPNQGGKGYYLAAHHNLPPVMEPENVNVWGDSCLCQDQCNSHEPGEIYEQLTCSRLANTGVTGNREHGHISIPLWSGERILGIMNLVGPEQKPLDPTSVAILTIIGAHLGTALDRKHQTLSALHSRFEEQAALLALSNKLLSRPNLEDVMSFLVEEVVQLLQVDACALLLPDEKTGYLVFRASAGWQSDPVVERRHVSSNQQSISGKVMHSQEPIIFRSSKDRDNALEMKVEWFESEEFEGTAIIPLIVEGQSIGVLALADRTPREFSEEEIRFIQIVANQAGIAIVNARLQKEEILLHRLEEELSIGRRIQRSLLPQNSPSLAGWEFSDIYRPAQQVSGDFYDFFELSLGNGRLGLVIGDVAGKGVPAALFMSASRTLIRSTALADLTPASTLKEANRLILQDSRSDLFLSAFYGILDPGNGRFTFANAGHNPPLWFQAKTGDFQALAAKGVLLCVLDDISLEEKSIHIAGDDILVFYTDGVTEAVNQELEEFGLQRLQQVIAANSRKGAANILEAIVEAIDSFIGDMEQQDDFTVIVAERKK